MVYAYPFALSRMLPQFLSGGFPVSVLERISMAVSGIPAVPGIPALAFLATDVDDCGISNEDVVAMKNT